MFTRFPDTWISNSYSMYTMLFDSVILFGILMNSIMLIFIKKKINTHFFISNIIIFGILSSIIFPLLGLAEFGKATAYQEFEIGMQVGISVIISFATYSLITLLNSFIKQTEKLGEDVLYKDGYILEKFANEQIWQYIKNNKIKNAYVMKLAIHGLESTVTQHGSSFATKIKSTVFREVRDKLQVFNPLFYMQSDNSEYYVILPIEDISKLNLSISFDGNNLKKRKPNDSLKFIEKILNEISKENSSKNKDKVKIQLFSFLGIYGLNSNDIQSLNNQLSTLNANYGYSNQNPVFFYNSSSSFDDQNENKSKVLEDLNIFSPKDINISLSKIKMNNSKRNIYKSNVSLFKKFIFTKEDIYNLSDIRSTRSVIICHISAKTIKEFVAQNLVKKNNYLIIEYPQAILEQKHFNVTQLISTLSSYQMPYENLILEIQVDNQDTFEQMLENLDKLNEKGFNIIFSADSNSETREHAYTNGDYLDHVFN
ncbi:MAG: hypothetical protein ACRC4M_00115 [Mycoplasma sp.]